MVGQYNVTVIREDMIIKGSIRRCRQLEVQGYIEGEIEAGSLLVHPEGRVFGKVRADNIEVLGTVQGDVVIKHLCHIRSSGKVAGSVIYGELAMESGADLTADVRNVPPTLGGDFELAVDKGRAVRITTRDLTAHDPDDVPENLIYTISNARNGFVSLGGSRRPVENFTQADIMGDRVLFVHDGSMSPEAAFDVVVADKQGATSGEARRVTISVRG
ncbi:MAG: polymer-forming cytoskeletal protein [Hyphomicrobiaceae bacterium]